MVAAAADHKPGRLRLGARGLAAVAAATAALLHLTVVPEHLDEWWVYGVFFLGLSAAQAVLVRLLLRGPPGTPLLLAAIIGTLAVVVLYVLTRTSGLPVGPVHGYSGAIVRRGVGNGVPVLPGSLSDRHIEPIGAIDLSCLAAELVLIAALVGQLPTRVRHRTTNVMLVAGLAALLPQALR